ncbi:transcription factor bHLH47 [Quillaja saponaria]|uniref:Transcription factor bHLH47 n=1 Tax=Quillaja saponaria TaxID=32244 RepID=A0AAD7VK28_QUISA|nr:transcription factor bHLH47 [Quillaja saponaria]
MGSEAPAPLVDNVNMLKEASGKRLRPSKKNPGKAPKRIHKAEREKLKREHLNELFLDLANALELTEENNGKASILCEAARLLRDLLAQIKCLKKENESLLSESCYVNVEKNELKEENSALESQIEKLHGELEARVAHLKHDLNAPPLELQPELTSNFTGDGLRVPQGPAVFVVPLGADIQAFPAPNAAELQSNPTSNVSKPHARYPTAADSWPSKLLGEQQTSCKELQVQISSNVEGGRDM